MRTRTTPPTGAAIRAGIFTAVMVLAACGGDDQADTVPNPTSVSADTIAPADETDDGVTAESTADTTAAATTESPDSTLQPQTTDAPVLNGQDPNEIIITLADMPTGWSPTPPDDESETDDSESDLACLDASFESIGLANDLSDDSDTPHAEASFSQSDFGPFVVSAVSTGIDSGKLGEFMDALPEAFASCDGTTDTDGVTYSVLPVSFPDLGDQTFATRIDGTGGMIPISLLLAFTRVDDVLIFSTNAAVGGGIDAALLEDLTGTMVDRA